MSIEIIAFKNNENYRQKTMQLIKDLHLCKRIILTKKLMLINKKTNEVLVHNYLLNN